MTKLPTLTSSKTCLITPKEVYNRLLMYFYVSSAKQSNLYGKNVASLPNILNNYTSIGDVTDAVEERFTKLLESQFTDVYVQCSYENDDTELYRLIINSEVTSNGVAYVFRDIHETNIFLDNERIG